MTEVVEATLPDCSLPLGGHGQEFGCIEIPCGQPSPTAEAEAAASSPADPAVTAEAAAAAESMAHAAAFGTEADASPAAAAAAADQDGASETIDGKFDDLFNGKYDERALTSFEQVVDHVNFDVQALADAATTGKQETMDERGTTLKRAAQSGFDLRCSLGQLFTQQAGNSEEYRGLKGQPGSRKAQAEFRQKWAQEKFKEYTKSKDTSSGKGSMLECKHRSEQLLQVLLSCGKTRQCFDIVSSLKRPEAGYAKHL